MSHKSVHSLKQPLLEHWTNVFAHSPLHHLPSLTGVPWLRLENRRKSEDPNILETTGIHIHIYIYIFRYTKQKKKRNSESGRTWRPSASTWAWTAWATSWSPTSSTATSSRPRPPAERWIRRPGPEPKTGQKGRGWGRRVREGKFGRKRRRS